MAKISTLWLAALAFVVIGATVLWYLETSDDSADLEVRFLNSGTMVSLRSMRHPERSVSFTKARLRKSLDATLLIYSWHFTSAREDGKFKEVGIGEHLTVEKAVLRRFEKTKSSLENFSRHFCNLKSLFVLSNACGEVTPDILHQLISEMRPEAASHEQIQAINQTISKMLDELTSNADGTYRLPRSFSESVFYNVLATFLNEPELGTFIAVKGLVGGQERSFEMQANLVTQKQWVSVMGSNPSFFSLNENCPDSFQLLNGISLCPQLPAESAEVEQVREFLEKASVLDRDFSYALPSSDEWELAARAGGKSQYFFGETEFNADQYSWNLGNSNLQTQPVGTKLPNDWGLYDMAGNVWQIVDSAPDAVSTDAPKGQSINAPGTLIRGGSWLDAAPHSKVEHISKIFKNWVCYDVGFRVIRKRKPSGTSYIFETRRVSKM